MWVRPLEDPLEEGIATHSSILACRTPWMRNLVDYSHRVTKSQTPLKQLSTAHINFLRVSNLMLAVLVLHCCTLAFSSC